MTSGVIMPYVFAVFGFFAFVLLNALGPASAAPKHPEFQGCPFMAKNGDTVYDFAGDVYELVGQAVSLDCKLSRNATGDSRNLMWMFNQTQIPDENVERVDNRTLRLNLVNVTVDNSGPYRCRLRDKAKGICFAKIKVGYPPLQVENFTCTSTNWKYLVCSWVAPYNPIKTTYNLVLNDGIADRKSCEIKTMPKEPTLQYCNFSDDTDIPYPMYRPNLTFRFTANNKFGSSTFEFRVDHYSRVIPASPVDVNAVSETSRSLRVTWKFPPSLKRFPPGLICRVFHRSQWSSSLNYSAVILEKNVNAANLSALVPHSKYSVGVGCLSSTANPQDETMWSATSWIDVFTLPDVPGSPPTVAPGSFHVRQYMNNRTVVIYWKSIVEEQYYGKDLHYLATARKFGQTDLLGPVSWNEGTAEFKNLSLNDGYEFSVWSANEVGKSDKKATLVVETPRNMPKEPSTLMVVAYNATVYEVSWSPPSSHVEDAIDGYTVFWTESNDRFERNDRGYLNWQLVDESTRRMNVTVDGRRPFYHFGVSSNSKMAAGSLLWNSCIMSYNGTIGKLKKVSVVRASSTTIRVTWSLDCSEKLGIITGYKVYYCLAEQQQFDNCSGDLREIFIDGINVNTFDIGNNVRPFSVYKIVVSAITKAGEGEHSDPMFVRTGEAVPSIIENVHVLDASNSSFLVTWSPPNSPNGILLRYNVYHSSSVTNERRSIYQVAPNIGFQQTKPALAAIYQLNITDYVLPYANYSITVEACTKAGCSARSNPTTVLTDVGVPGQMYPPIARLHNRTCVLVQPAFGYDLNGPGDFWEVRAVSVDVDNETSSELVAVMTFNTSDDMVYVPVHCGSSDIDVSVSLQSRLINLKNGEFLVGQWSDYAKSTGYCVIGPSTSLIVGIVLGSTLALTVILLFTIFATKRAKVVWYKIQNFNVKLPEGLHTTKDTPIFANGQKMSPKMNSYANLGTISGPAATKPLIDDQRFRNDSGGTNRSACSTDGLLLRDYGGGKNPWAANDSNLASINQESVSSMPSTVQTHLSSDSSMELNSSVPESPDSVFGPGEHPLKNAMILSPPVASNQNVPLNGFNPTLTTIGESLDQNNLSRDATPRHYSKFASYLDPDDVLAKARLDQRGNYVAPPYSKFSANDDVVVAPRAIALPTTSSSMPNKYQPQAYSRFGSNKEVDVQSLPKMDIADNPRSSLASQNSVGYSVFGLSDEQQQQPSQFQPMTNGLAGPSKGYVMAANMLDEKQVGDQQQQYEAAVVDMESTGNGLNDDEYFDEVDPLEDAQQQMDPRCSYVDMAAHKRSPSNTSSLTAGYSKMGLSRPTSTCSDTEQQQYVQANPTTRPNSSPSKAASTSSPHRSSSILLDTPTSPTYDGVELKVPNGYTSVNRLVTDTGSNS